MGKVHPAAWIGVVLNGVMLRIAQSDLHDEVEFSYFLLGFLAVQVLGLVMLAAGSRAGGIVGAIGSALYLPIGILGLYGFMRSRAMILAGSESEAIRKMAEEFDSPQPQAEFPGGLPPASFEKQPSQRAASGETAMALDTAMDNISDPAPSHTAEHRLNDTSLAMNTKIPGPRPLYEFFHKHYFVPCFVICLIMLVPLGLSAVFYGFLILWLQVRLSDLKVMVLYPDHLICMSSPAVWASELTIPYGSIATAELRGNLGIVQYQRLGGEVGKVTIPFRAISKTLQEQARAAYIRTLRDKGVSVRVTF